MKLDEAIAAQKPLVQSLLDGVAAIGADPPGITRDAYGRGEEGISARCHREAIAQSLCYTWPKDLLEAGKRRLAGDTARAATSGEVKAVRPKSRALKKIVAEQALEFRLLKKSMIADGGERA